MKDAKAATTVIALIVLAKRITTFATVLFNTVLCAFWTTNAVGPLFRSKKIVAFIGVDKVVNPDIQF
ncbi:MAG: hypothetical protein LWX55_13360 [Deltaproteobacteria bacterium]|jgi:hypothetical protein|nr:hypothetical protein [Deltaproteobacteria bacterium]